MIIYLTGLGVVPSVSNEILIHPNPSNGSFFIDFNTPIQSVNIELYDEYGKLIYKLMNQAINLARQPVLFDATVAGIPSGCYYLKISEQDKVYVKKLTIIK